MKHLLAIIAAALTSPTAPTNDGIKVKTGDRHGSSAQRQFGYIGTRPALNAKPAFGHHLLAKELGAGTAEATQLDTAFKNKTHLGLVAGTATQ